MSDPKKRSVVLIALFLFIIVLLGVTIYEITYKQDDQKAKYLEIKEDFRKIYPSQEMIVYPWNPTSSTKILPLHYIVPAIPDNNLSIRACPDEFESASFIITAQKDITEIGMTVSNPQDQDGNVISGDVIDIRLVKVWYQAYDKNIGGFKEPGNYLTPELLVKDDALVQVDYVNKKNFLRITVNGSEEYIDISSRDATFPADAEIYDAAELQPFSLKKNENKQIWLTVHVPANTPSGDYYGDIAITTPSALPVLMNFSITVLPFDLEPSPLRYILYYKGRIAAPLPKAPISDVLKTPSQYSRELQDMKDHGVLYPTFAQYDYEPSLIKSALSLRNQSGLPKDRIYVLDNVAYIGNATDAAGLARVAGLVKKWRNYTDASGYGTIYFYGMDEVSGNLVLSQRDAWKTVHDNGGRMVTTAYENQDPIELTGDLLDAVNLGTEINATAASEMHHYGHEIYLYNQPQVGVENPEIYRKNYGFDLWTNGYDGAMNFAYQWGFGNSIWNDFDSGGIRDHVFAYPTSNGVIDTIQWEGWREGVDDTRYVATLIKKEGNDTAAQGIIYRSLANGDEMATIRKKVIDQILIS